MYKNYNQKTKLFNNQDEVMVTKEEVTKTSGRQFLAAYLDTMSNAMNDLSGTEFKVWLYLMTYRNKTSVGYSPEHIARFTGISKDSAKTAKKALVSKGYLKVDKDGKYLFSDVPSLTPDLSMFIEKREYNGSYYTKGEVEEMVAAQGGSQEDANRVWEMMNKEEK